MTPTRLSAMLFSLAAAGVCCFQVAVAAGAPWGQLTQGGQNPGVLPPVARGFAAFSALLLFAFAWVVRQRAKAGADAGPRLRRAAWLVVAYCALGVLANAATPSAAERALWLPVVLVMFASSLLVARSR